MRERLAYALYRAAVRAGRRLTRASPARAFSNQVLAHIGARVEGNVLNVSGWRDADKQGRRYRDYFPNARSYTVSNYPSPRKGLADVPDSLPLDLTRPVPPHLRGGFDVVFAHTVLEHVFEVERAVEALAALTRDLCVVVVPLVQRQHGIDEGEGDFWRFTPMALDRLFAPHGLSRVCAVMNDQPWWDVYVVWAGSRSPERWAHLEPGTGEAAVPRGT